MEYLVSITALEVAAQVVQPEFAVEVTVGGPGSPGTPGQGVPVGGTAGQVLEKIDGTDYNTQWVDAPGGAVDSVNGQTGVVVLTQDNVGDGTTYKQYSQTEKTKLAGIEAGAQVNVNADWNAASGDAEILNKPAIPSIAGLATVAYVDTQDALKVDKVAGKSLLADTEISRLASMTAIFTTALQAAYDGAVAWIAANGAALIAHLSNTSNPHNTTAAQVGAEPTISAGTPAQYWRGDKTWQDFATAAIAAVVTRLLPSGGTTGQVLAKTSGTDYAVGWSTPSSGSTLDILVQYVVGRYITPIITRATMSAGTYVAGSYYFTIVPVRRSVTLDRIQAEVTTLAAGGSFQRGIYDAHPTTGNPRNLLVQSGNLSAAATGTVSATISVTLSPGIYFLTLQQSAAASFRNIVSGTIDPGRDATMLTTSFGCLQQTGTYTAGSMTATASGSPAISPAANPPLVTARISALP